MRDSRSPAALEGGRVLVTGATGFLGGALVRRLLAEGASVRALVRSPARAGWLAEAGVEVVVGDITDKAALLDALRDVSVVHHLAGRLLVPGRPADEYRRTHVEGTRLLISCVRDRPGLERLVHCSTTGVLGPTGDRPADEAAPLRPGNVYEATKAEAEEVVREAVSKGIPCVIVRPGLVYGPGDLHLLAFFRAVLRRRFRPIGRGTVWLHPIYVDDMIDALLRCRAHPAALGECFHIAGPRPVSLAGLAATIAGAGDTRLPRGCIPLPAARAVAALGDWLPGPLRGAAPLTRSRLEFLTHSRVYDVGKARRLLGFAAGTELAAGIARSMAWYRREGHLPLAPVSS